ncbi:MAG: hypothetical protein WAM78_03240 [Candidatus Sulfotelmatobacter sp.]
METPSIPGAGTGSSRENIPTQTAPAEVPGPEDAVKVQWDTSDQIAVYQFVNQQGSLILQVPSEQMLNLASQITEELAQQSTSGEVKPVGGAGGKNHGS